MGLTGVHVCMQNKEHMNRMCDLSIFSIVYIHINYKVFFVHKYVFIIYLQEM